MTRKSVSPTKQVSTVSTKIVPLGFESPVVRRYEEQEDIQDDSGVTSFAFDDVATSTPISHAYSEIVGTSGVTQRCKKAVDEDALSPIIAGNLGNGRDISDWNQTSTLSSTDSSSHNLVHDVIDEIRLRYGNGGLSAVIEYYWFHLLALVLLVLSGWAFLSVVLAQDSHGKHSSYAQYVNGINGMKRKVPHLSKSDVNILKFVGHQWLVDHAEEPIVLLIGGRNASDVVSYLVPMAAKIAGQKKGGKVHRISSAVDRAGLHETLQSELEAGSKNGPVTFGLTSVEEMVWDAPLVLHAFADHISYPVPYTLVILSVSLPEESTPAACDEMIQSHLTSKWIESGGTEDNVGPILSRILGYTICV